MRASQESPHRGRVSIQEFNTEWDKFIREFQGFYEWYLRDAPPVTRPSQRKGGHSFPVLSAGI